MNIKKEIYTQIVREAREHNPLECCGYLAGNNGAITKAYPMNNIDESRIHYSFDPQEQFKTVKEIRNKGLKVLAVYHSHPETPARPSEEDIRLAYDPEVSYVIISLCEEKGRGREDVKSFKIRKGQVEPEELTIQ
ncbi:MAG: M67 family metallopeptidase [Desulfobulbaceae bacterium]|nr:M67 family metallopeptidase [Desulfobulbaceae bacterium]